MKKTIVNILICMLLFAMTMAATANINQSFKNLGNSSSGADFTMTIQNTVGMPGDQNHIIPVTGTWSETFYRLFMRINWNSTILEHTGEIIFDDIFQDFLTISLPSEDYVDIVIANQIAGVGIPPGEGLLLSIGFNISETAPFGPTFVNLSSGYYQIGYYPNPEVGVWLDPNIPELFNGTLFIGTNEPPETPDAPTGPGEGEPDVEYTFTGNTTDPDGDDIAYLFDWGDGTYSDWTDFVPSGTEGNASYTWSEEGTYDVRVKAKDINEFESSWSPVHTISIEEESLLVDLNIKSIEGGIGITAVINITGEGDATDVEWHIIVTGGLLGMVDADVNNTEDELKAGKNMTVETGSLGFLHLGPLKINVTAEAANADKVTAEATAFIIGPFVLGVTIEE